MSSDWIKMRTDLCRDPKVLGLATIMVRPDGPLAVFVSQNLQCNMAVTRNVTRNACVGALLSVWGVVRHRGTRLDDDLIVKNALADIIDDIADLPGFGAAMIEVGWLIERDFDLVFPGFFNEYNADPKLDQKSKNAERQRRFRNAKRNVTDNVTVTPKSNTEKRREEKSISLPSKDIGRARFRPPDLEEIKKFWLENTLNGNAEEFQSYYDSNGWRVGKNPMKNWKAAARGWSSRQKQYQGAKHGSDKNRIGPGQVHDPDRENADLPRTGF